MDTPNTPNSPTRVPATPEIPATPVQAERFCRHIQPNSDPCVYPALAPTAFCYYHGKIRRPHRTVAARTSVIDLMRYETAQLLAPKAQQAGQYPNEPTHAQQTAPYLPFQNAETIQIAITALLSAVSHGQVHPEQANLLLKTLRLAGSNIRNLAQTHPSDTAKPRRLHRKKPPNPNRMNIFPATLEE